MNDNSGYYYSSISSSVSNPNVICDPAIFRCTLGGIPESNELLEKCRLPLGLTLQPFRDIKNLFVMQTNITRCRYCRTYINPYVYLADSRHWKCNVCYRLNDLPEEFCWDPATKSFGSPMRRPELQCPTIEYIAPSEYMLRPPQPPIYLFIFDVSSNAVDCGYLHPFSEQLLLALDRLPGDDRVLVGFIGVDAAMHFFQFTDSNSPPRQLLVYDLEEAFCPVFDGVVVPLSFFKNSIYNFVQNLPTLYEHNSSPSNCLGSTLLVAKDLIAEIGGRITILLATQPNIGKGALNQRVDTESKNKSTKGCFGPQTDFYKSLALECTGKQIGIDIFAIGSRHLDLATLSDASKFSSGTVYHFPNFHFIREQMEVKRFQSIFQRYLTRKLGLEAVLRIRCSRGVSLHSFFGNFFVRSTDLLAMANVSPDSAIAVQVQLEESLSNQQAVCFQAALLYTSTKGDRRIRVHTLCVPVFQEITRIYQHFDISATTSLLAKMAAERAMQGADLTDCREALINAAIDALGKYGRSIGHRGPNIVTPEGNLSLMSLYVLGLLKNRAFSGGAYRRYNIDQRMTAMLLFRSAPIEVILLETCPSLYAVHTLDQLPQEQFPNCLPLSYQYITKDGLYILDTGTYVYLYVCAQISSQVLYQIFGVNTFSNVDEDTTLQQLETSLSKQLHSFLRHLQESRRLFAPLLIIREDGPNRELFTSRLVLDRTESSHSYIEFCQHIQREINNANN